MAENAATYRLERGALARMDDYKGKIHDYVQGKSVFNLAELQTSLAYEQLEEIVNSLRQAVVKNFGDPLIKQRWLLMESLLRDAKYSTRGYAWCRRLGYNGLIRETFESGKVLADADYDRAEEKVE
jgi:hypothetical protein